MSKKQNWQKNHTLTPEKLAIAREVLAKDRAPERVNVYEIMSKPVVSVDPDMDIRYCARLFHKLGFSYAPVIEGERVLGIVGYTDLVLNGLVK